MAEANLLTEGAVSMMCKKETVSSPPVLQICDLGVFGDEDDGYLLSVGCTRMSMYWVYLSDGVHKVQANFDTEKKDLVEKNGLKKGSVVRLTQYDACDSTLFTINDLVLLVDKLHLIGKPIQFLPSCLAPDSTKIYWNPYVGFDIPSDGEPSFPEEALTRKDTLFDVRNPSFTPIVTESAVKSKRKRYVNNDESTLFLKGIHEMLKETVSIEKEKLEASRKRAYQKELKQEMKVMSQSMVGLTEAQRAYWETQQSIIMKRHQMNEETAPVQ